MIFAGYRHSIGNWAWAIRNVLNDSATSPRYIETVSRGFRFVASVEIIARSSTNGNGQHSYLTDALLLETRRIRLDLPITLDCRGLILLLYRCEGLRDQHPQHANLAELQLLIADINLAIKRSALMDPGWANHNVSLEIAACVFDDPNAFSIPDPDVIGRWKTLGLVPGKVLLMVDHTGRGEHGKQVVRVNGARRATPEERRFYEQTQK
jgi:uncharacterized DUF497 family protein